MVPVTTRPYLIWSTLIFLDFAQLIQCKISFSPSLKRVGHWDFRFWGFFCFVPNEFGFLALVFVAVCGLLVF